MSEITVSYTGVRAPPSNPRRPDGKPATPRVMARHDLETELLALRRERQALTTELTLLRAENDALRAQLGALSSIRTVGDGITIDGQGMPRIKGRTLALSLTESRLLRAIVQCAPATATHQEIASVVWGDALVDIDITEGYDRRNLRSVVNRLRGKLRAAHAPFAIVTIPALGYALMAGSLS